MVQNPWTQGGPERKIPQWTLEVLSATELSIHRGFQQLRHLLNNNISNIYHLRMILGYVEDKFKKGNYGDAVWVLFHASRKGKLIWIWCGFSIYSLHVLSWHSSLLMWDIIYSNVPMVFKRGVVIWEDSWNRFSELSYY